jgi:hypothetical protein
MHNAKWKAQVPILAQLALCIMHYALFTLQTLHYALCIVHFANYALGTLLALTQGNILGFIPKAFCFVDFIASDPLDRMPKRPLFECIFVLETEMFVLQTHQFKFLFPMFLLAVQVV